MSVIVATLLNLTSVVDYPVEISKVYDGIRIVKKFRNKWGVSIMCHSKSYGGSEGYWEVGVTYNGELIYNNPITGYDAVTGYCSTDEVLDIINDVRTLPDGPECG